MASKRYGQENFFIDMPDGTSLDFYCWTTSTRTGFCHTVWCSRYDQTSKVSYCNRTWESYKYQTALQRAFEKLPKEYREVCVAWDKAKVNHEHEECERFIAGFKKAYDATSPEFKEKLANSDIHLETEQDAKNLQALMQLDALLNM